MPTEILEQLNPRTLGAELKHAREQRGLTQQEAADAISVSRTTVTAIEKGERRVRSTELIKLAALYGRKVGSFVRARPPMSSFSAQFRGRVEHDGEVASELTDAVSKLEEYAHRYLELEQLTGAPSVKRYPPQYETRGIGTEQVAEIVAIQERNRLGLGDGPITTLRETLEQEVGIRIFYFPLPPKFSAIYGYADDVGACIAVNSLHPKERQRWSLAHEYAHFLAHRYRLSIYVEEGYQRVPRNERFADGFAGCFLMPTSSVTRRYNDIRQNQEGFSLANLCVLAHPYGVSVAAMAYRLEELKFLPPGTWNYLKESGVKVRSLQKELGLPEIKGSSDRFPIRYQILAVQAFQSGDLSEGQLASFLDVHRVEARDIVERLGHEELGGAPLDLDLSQILNG